MVEVFKTDVSNCEDASKLIAQIHFMFPDYKANFDLEDCDLILRVQTSNGAVESAPIISLLKHCGFYAEVLEDDFQPNIEIFLRR